MLEEPAASWEVALSLLIHVLEAEVLGLGAQCQCGRDERGGLAALCVPAKHRVVCRQVQRKGWLENCLWLSWREPFLARVGVWGL